MTVTDRAVGGSAARTLSPALILTGLLLVAGNLRAGITTVGPVIEELQRELGLSSLTASALISLPLVAFAVVSPFAPALARSLGLERALAGGLVVLAVGLVVRSLPGQPLLWLGTGLLGMAIAVLNVMLPALVKRDFPHRIGQITGTYSAVQSSFAAIAAGAAVPVAGLTALGWRLPLAMWSGLALIALGAMLPQLRGALPDAAAGLRNVDTAGLRNVDTAGLRNVDTAGLRNADAAGLRNADTAGLRNVDAAGLPNAGTAGLQNGGVGDSERASAAASGVDRAGAVGRAVVGGLAGGRGRSPWRTALGWQVTAFMALQSTGYYVLITWLPSMETAAGVSAATAGVHQLLLNGFGIAGSIACSTLIHRSRDQRLLGVIVPVLLAGAAGGILAFPAYGAIWASLAGVGGGASIVLALSFFGLRTVDHTQAAQLSGMAQSVGYIVAAAGPIVVGALHDATGSWSLPLTVIIVLDLILITFGWLSGRPRLIG
ncbi:MFS transporter [Actinoplanes sp. NPDC051851]|uniref:MFS transporter n=1 Tax=Actinoplanes sp. NPDC051851 TaxID=3154753 RepID=UPI0034238B41